MIKQTIKHPLQFFKIATVVMVPLSFFILLICSFLMFSYFLQLVTCQFYYDIKEPTFRFNIFSPHFKFCTDFCYISCYVIHVCLVKFFSFVLSSSQVIDFRIFLFYCTYCWNFFLRTAFTNILHFYKFFIFIYLAKNNMISFVVVLVLVYVFY